MRRAWWRLSSLLALAAVVGGLLGSSSARAAEPRVLTGTIDGADFKIEVPENWNGTLLLFSHGGVAPGGPNPAVDAPASARPWLLDHGYALAGSSFGSTGWVGPVAGSQRDNIGLLDYVVSAVGKPTRTIAWGASLGGLHSMLLAQNYPQRFDAALPISGNGEGAIAFWNIRLDPAFVIKSLVPGATDLEIVNISDPATAIARARQVLAVAQETPAGRARIALAAAVGDVPGWFDPTAPAPATDDYLAQEMNQFNWLNTTILGYYLAFRWDMEQGASGNASSNTGIDYRQQLDRSIDRDEVYALYQAAGEDVDSDLQILSDAPRIQAEQGAKDYLNSFVLDGRVGVPVLTLHTTGDGSVMVVSEGAYADSVRAAGQSALLRQVFVNRAGHVSVTGAEEISALLTLVHRLDSGHWEGDDANTLNAQAAALGSDLNVLSFGVPQPMPMPPAFVDFRPAPFLRPWDARCSSGVPAASVVGELGPVCL